MKELTNIKTMSSREIAELTGKRHDNVLRDCDTLNEYYEELHLLKIEEMYSIRQLPNGGEAKDRYFELTRMQSFDLMTGYDVPLRIKVNRRWEELENKEQQYQIPQTFSEALRLAADKTEENERLTIENKTLAAENKRMQPRDQFVDIVFNSDKLMTMSEAAKALKLPYGRNTLCKNMRELGVFYKNSNEPKQEYVSCGYFEYKLVRTLEDGRIIMQPFCSSRGLGFIAKKLGVVTAPGTQITITVKHN